MDLELVENIANQLKDLNFTGIVNISGTGDITAQLVVKYHLT